MVVIFRLKPLLRFQCEIRGLCDLERSVLVSKRMSRRQRAKSTGFLARGGRIPPLWDFGSVQPPFEREVWLRQLPCWRERLLDL